MTRDAVWGLMQLLGFRVVRLLPRFPDAARYPYRITCRTTDAGLMAGMWPVSASRWVYEWVWDEDQHTPTGWEVFDGIEPPPEALIYEVYENCQRVKT